MAMNTAPIINADSPPSAPPPRLDDTTIAALLSAISQQGRPRGALDVVKDVCLVIAALSLLAIVVGLGAGSIRWGFGL